MQSFWVVYGSVTPDLNHLVCKMVSLVGLGRDENEGKGSTSVS